MECTGGPGGRGCFSGIVSKPFVGVLKKEKEENEKSIEKDVLRIENVRECAKV